MTMTSGPIDLDRLDLDAVRAGALRDRPVTVLGLDRSGLIRKIRRPPVSL